MPLKRPQSQPQVWIAIAMVLLLVLGFGVAALIPENSTGVGTIPQASEHPGPDDEALVGLAGYVRSIENGQPSSISPPAELLPDVDTMIGRLAARLETSPEDIEGWRLLGWSYFHTARYEESASAFERALQLDPGSAELKLSYTEAMAKASEVNSLESLPSADREAAIRSMVDGLANRLENSPRDAEGWIRLMRSRIVLGENEAAATALRKALGVFKDDKAASDHIAAAALELGLKTE